MLFPWLSTRLTHQAKLISSLWNVFFRNSISPCPVCDLLDFVHPPACPGVHRRIQVGKLPLVGRNLAVGMLELLKQQKPQILFCESGINQREGHTLRTPNPRPQTRDIPIGRARQECAWNSGAANANYECLVAPHGRCHSGRSQRATYQRRTSKSACSTAFRPAPALNLSSPLRLPREARSRRKTHRPLRRCWVTILSTSLSGAASRLVCQPQSQTNDPPGGIISR